jgi:HEAT repeat protein
MNLNKLTNDYLMACEKNWGFVRAGDIEIPLDNVYFMLETLETSPKHPLEGRSDLPKERERLKHAGVDIAKYSDGSDSLIPNIPIELSSVLHFSNHFVLLGEPGAGKTTTLQFIGLCLATNSWAEQKLKLQAQFIPVLISLKKYAELLGRPDISLNQIFAQEVALLLNVEVLVAQQLLEFWNKGKKLFFLFDGLDEIQGESRTNVREKISFFVNSTKNQNNRIAITSRLAGYESFGRKTNEYTLMPFKASLNIGKYLLAWLRVFRPEWTKDIAEEKAFEMLSEIGKQPNLAQILDNALFLRMSAEVYAQKGHLGKNRGDLYELWVEELWQRALKRGVDESVKDAIWGNLEVVAWSLQNNIPLPQTINLEALRTQLGLIAFVDTTVVFSHLTIQEYFAAKYLKRTWEKNINAVLEFLSTRLFSPQWREVIIFLAHLLENNDATRLSEFILRKKTPHFERHLFQPLFFVGDLIVEGTNIDSNDRERVVSKLCRLVVPRYKFLKNTRFIGWVVSFLKWVIFSFVTFEIWSLSQSWWGCGLFFLAWIWLWFKVILVMIKRVERLVWYWLDLKGITNTEARKQAVRTLGKIRDTNTLGFIYKGIEDEAWSVRQASIKALKGMIDKSSIPFLETMLQNENEDYRYAATILLGQLGSNVEVPLLINALGDSNEKVRRAAVGALGLIGDERAINPLIDFLFQEGYSSVSAYEVSYALKMVLGNRRNVSDAVNTILGNKTTYIHEKVVTDLFLSFNPSEVVPLLICHLESDEIEIVNGVKKILKRIGLPAVPYLIDILRENQYGRKAYSAIKVLGEISDPSAIPLISAFLSHENLAFRAASTRAIGNFHNADIQSSLENRLNDSEEFIQLDAACSLSYFSNQKALKILINKYKHQDTFRRREIAEALSNYDNQSSKQTLINLAMDEDELVRVEAIKSLGTFEDKQLTRFITKKLQDSSKDVRSASATILGELREEFVTPNLVKALYDEDFDVRSSAARALGKIGNEQCAIALIQYLVAQGKERRNSRKLVYSTKFDNAILDAFYDIGNVGLPHLHNLLEKERDEEILSTAIDAVGKLGNVESTPFLIKLLRSGRENVRRSSVEALGQLSDKLSLEQTKKILRRLWWIVYEEKLFNPIYSNILSENCIETFNRIIFQHNTLTVNSLPYVDPLGKMPETYWQKYGVSALRGFLWTLSIGTGGLVLVLSATLQDTLGNLIKPVIQQYSFWSLVGIVVIISILGGLIGLLTENLKEKAK